jgi:hypothetical protein
LRNVLKRRSAFSPEFHLKPESSTAMRTSGRPVVTVQAVSRLASASATCAPRIPISSRGSMLTGKLFASGEAENFQTFSPRSSRSFGTWPFGVRSVLKSRLSPPDSEYGKSAFAPLASASAAIVTAMMTRRILLPPGGRIRAPA